ncbi:MAG: hypothetical protein IT337_07835 [Thermomicrobiales bacterium]|nr:hypothetical protein [Thermomicrobiales bacterium]
MTSQMLAAPVNEIVTAIRDDTIGGAADMARLTAQALDALAREASLDDFGPQLDDAVAALIEVTPSIMPVVRVLHLTVAAAEANPDDPRPHVSRAAQGFVDWLEGSLDRIAAIGADLIRDGERIFLYSMSSTVYRMVEAALAQGKRVSLVTTESRPANEGLTSLKRLCPQGVEVTIGIDAAMVQLMRGCTSVHVGSDTVTSAGQCLAKVGCYAAALTAKHYGLPLYVDGDTSKFDPASIRGVPIKIREMPASEVVPGEIPVNARVRNPIFEIVPADLVTAYVTELGILHPGAVYGLMADIPWSDRVGDLVAASYRS